jgi:hypothetical protein
MQLPTQPSSYGRSISFYPIREQIGGLFGPGAGSRIGGERPDGMSDRAL